MRKDSCQLAKHQVALVVRSQLYNDVTLRGEMNAD